MSCWILARQSAADLLHELHRVAVGLVGEMQIDHGGVDVLVAEERLDGVEAGPGFEHVRGKRMAQRVDAHVRNIEFLAGGNKEALERGDRHGIGGRVHARPSPVDMPMALSDIRKKQERVFVKLPKVNKVAEHGRRKRDHPILVALAVADDELVFSARNVVDGKRKALGKAQPAAVDELERGAVAAQAHMVEQIVDLLAGEHGRKLVMVLGFDLRKDGPVVVAELIDKEKPGRGDGLSDGPRPPALDRLDVEDVVAKLVLGNHFRIAGAVLVDEAHVPVVGIAGAVGIGAQGQPLGKLRHRRVRMVVRERVVALATIRVREGPSRGNRRERRG